MFKNAPLLFRVVDLVGISSVAYQNESDNGHRYT